MRACCSRNLRQFVATVAPAVLILTACAQPPAQSGGSPAPSPVSSETPPAASPTGTRPPATVAPVLPSGPDFNRGASDPNCGYFSIEAVQEAFGATVPGYTFSATDCKYIFGGYGTAYPLQLSFFVEVRKNGSPEWVDGFKSHNLHGQAVSGIGDQAALSVMPLQPSGDPEPSATSAGYAIYINSVKGQDTAFFGVSFLQSPSGPSLDQYQGKLIKLLSGIDF
ncbi:hypothetical protein [Sinomonas sp. G460-2]|uniref:hypothetical protein n=1 Tax=Sinomonas sp. G460-2 TaxID=3393464 RepID=UPI0039F05429